VHRLGEKTVVELNGRLGTRLPSDVEDDLLAAIQPDGILELDVTNLSQLNAAGLRTMLLLHRRVMSVGGRVSLVGITPGMFDVLDAIGFLHMPQSEPLSLDTPARPRFRRIDIYPTRHDGNFGLTHGAPLPFGAMYLPGSDCVNFSVYSRYAKSCTLVLFDSGESTPRAEIEFPSEFRVGNVFTMIVFGIDPYRIEYGFRIDGPFEPRRGHRFDRSKILIDPFAHALGGREAWGVPRSEQNSALFRSRLVPDDFDWEGDCHPVIPTEDLVIYEMHVRGFTRHPTSKAKHPGTFAALREKIPYLVDLGVNCVELMPICEFDERENPLSNPLTGERLYNYWGYSSAGFFAPKASYAFTGALGMQADELKALVKELHKNGIEVILDVVFNHTAENDERGPTISFRGLDNKTYYILTPDGRYQNFSGCGNTLNCNHPVVRDMVVNCLRHWVSQYHIDGFRFDLASILGRDIQGEPLHNPPLLEALAHDPVLADCKLIAEAWDAGGLYQVGSFPSYGRWAEWNGRYRDCVRRFLRGDRGQVGELAQRLMGSPDLYADRSLAASVNFVTCHDGFTLCDLVSYNEKHNEANGEGNRDGARDNLSWNCGVEGQTDDAGIMRLRARQMKNALAILMISRGVPMLLMGDEVARTQQGNNNPYCHDSPLTWLDWSLGERSAEHFRFARELIKFRKRQALLRFPLHEDASASGQYLEVSWHGRLAWQPDWSYGCRTLAFMLRGTSGSRAGDVLYVALNMDERTQSFGLPAPPAGRRWHVVLNTGMESPEDIWSEGDEPPVADCRYILVADRAVVVLVALPRARAAMQEAAGSASSQRIS
jgi:glycogen operon protein